LSANTSKPPAPRSCLGRRGRRPAAGMTAWWGGGAVATRIGALNGRVGGDAALAVPPLGHGNDLARALGVPLDVHAAAEFMLRAPARPMDLARVGEKAFGCVAGVGFDAETNRRANTWGPCPRCHARP